MIYWCPWCGNILRMITLEDLECSDCGFVSRKTKEKKSSSGLTIMKESYRNLKKVYDWFPEVLTEKPRRDMFSVQPIN